MYTILSIAVISSVIMSETMRTTIALKKYKRYDFFLLLVYLSLVKFTELAEAQDNNNYTFFNGNGSIELDHETDFDGVSIFPIYNETSDVLQYIIKWEDPIPNDGHELRVIPMSSCAVEFNSTYYIYENTTEFYVPLTNGHNFRLNKACIYNIELEINPQKLNIINYFLDVTDNTSTYIPSKTVLFGAIYNKTIDRVQYVIKWKDQAPSEGYHVIIKSSSSSKHCKPATYDSGHVNHNISELYIPPLSTHNFELHRHCIYDIEINADSRRINFTNRISGYVDVKSFLVTTVYNQSIDRIQYVIKWTEVAPDHGYRVTVVPKSGNSHCENDFFDSYHVNGSVSELFIPPVAAYDFILNGDCTYNIIVKVYQTEKHITNHIPVCVGSKCNCGVVNPKPSHRPLIERIDANLYNVSWYFPESKENNITDIGFYLLNETCERRDDILQIKPTILQNSYGIFSTQNVTKGKYCMSISLNNSFLCSYSYYEIHEVIPKIEDEGLSSWIHWIIIFVFVTIIMLVIIYYFGTIQSCIYKWKIEFTPPRQTFRYSPSNVHINNDRAGTELVTRSVNLTNRKDEYEFPKEEFTLLSGIGKGAFGEVLLAKIITTGKFVAVKRLRENATFEEKEDFAAEIEILKKIGSHPNIVTLIGCCTKEEPYMMIMEFIPCGDLKQYLLGLRNKWYRDYRDKVSTSDNSVFTSTSSAYILPGENDSPTTTGPKISVDTQYVNISIDTPKSGLGEFDFRIERVLDHRELQYFALQIARGMEHLEKIPITHRDLAARNILINERKELKISDFGLSRKGPYINSKLKKVPLRWMALESIEDHIYNNKSDVWSFAVVLWEIATLGAFPYEKVVDSMLPYYLQNGKRLQRPEICTDELYSLMLQCWSREQDLRPSFSELVSLLHVSKTRAYVDFTQLNPLYVFPPTENRRFFANQNEENTPKYLEFT